MTIQPVTNKDTWIIDNDGELLRRKFAGLTLLHPVLMLARIGARLEELITGDFVYSGRRLAEKAYLKEKKIAYIQNSAMPTEKRLTALKCRYIFLEFVKNFAKLVVQPLVSVGLTLVSLIGLTVAPFWARKAHGEIEYFFAKNGGPETFKTFSDGVSQLIAPCMASKRIWDNLNLYSKFKDYNANTIRALLKFISNKLEESPDFWKKRLGEVAYEEIQKDIKVFKQDIKKISFKDGKETEVNGELVIFSSAEMSFLNRQIVLFRQHLLTIKTALENGEKDFNSAIDLRSLSTSMKTLEEILKTSEPLPGIKRNPIPTSCDRLKKKICPQASAQAA